MAISHSSSTMTVTELLKAPRDSLHQFSKRLQIELRDLKNSPKEILRFSLVDESTGSNHWEAEIQGPVDTPYENGVFILDFHLPADYPFKPPKIRFKTKVFHPNISSKGDICLDILQSRWFPASNLQKTLLSVVSLLSDPNTDDFLVPEAAYLYKENREEYDRKAREWTQKYAHGDPAEAQENSNELNDLVDAITPSLSDHIVQQETVVIQPNPARRSARFMFAESLKSTTFYNGESKKYLPIVARCLRFRGDRQETYSLDFSLRHQLHDFDDAVKELNIDNELQSLALALEREGIKLEKRAQSKILVNELCTLIGKTPEEVGQGCLRLYSMNTFLYPQFNRFLREGDYTQIETYGSFVRLLCFHFDHPSSIEVHSIEVYRGMNLSSMMIDAYKEATKSEISFRWAGFSSTSKSREFAEFFDTNTLFIMQLKKIYSRRTEAIDISGYSQFPEEEEVLLKAGVEFTIGRVRYDDEKKKHYIYLNVYV